MAFAKTLCCSPGVPASIIAFIAVAESTGTQGSSGFESEDETVGSPLIGSSLFVSSLQATSINAAVQIVKNLRFIKYFFVKKVATSLLIKIAFFDKE